MAAEQSPAGLQPSKKNPGKVPKRIHKAEREKLKRDRLNELFLRLADTLELTEQNSGKASILGETTRVVKDMLDQIKCLKKENAALLSESQYVTVEKNELQAETSALQDQVGELKSVIKGRTVQMNLDLNVPPVESEEPRLTPYFPEASLKSPVGDRSLQQAPILNPVFVVTACPDFQIHPELNPSATGDRPMSTVSKPHPRYPTPSDSWPFQILEQRPREVGSKLHREQVVGKV